MANARIRRISLFVKEAERGISHLAPALILFLPLTPVPFVIITFSKYLQINNHG
jgi:hypothetical protein